MHDPDDPAKLSSASAENWRRVARGIRYVEGPVFDAEGWLYVVSPNDGRILRVDTDSGKADLWVGYDGIPAGLQFDSSGQLWVADMKRGILRSDHAGHIEPVVSKWNGRPMRGCNDCAFDSAGNLYFTAPAGSGPGKPVGEVFCLTADGAVHRLDGEYHFPNGIAVSADDRQLVVAETKVNRMLWVYDILHPGMVSQRRPLARLTGDGPSGPDGIEFDAAGQLLATNYSHDWLEVFDAAGRPRQHVRLPFARAANLHFGGSDGRDLIITEHQNHAIWITRWPHPGLRLANPFVPGAADDRPETEAGHR